MSHKTGLILKDTEKAASTKVPASAESSVRTFAPSGLGRFNEVNEVIL